MDTRRNWRAAAWGMATLMAAITLTTGAEPEVTPLVAGNNRLANPGDGA